VIAILNISPLDIHPLGEHEYVVKINTQEMARFTHCRSKGLPACLRAAADAVEREHEKTSHSPE
jgi:hypothetical protein